MTISNITPQLAPPYHDDWSETHTLDSGESASYQQILFKPGYAVQTRELNQIQTTLQSQLDYLGQYSFNDGARVLDGDILLYSLDFVKLTSNNDANLEDWIGATITGGVTGVTAIVKDVIRDTEDLLYIQYLSSGDDDVTDTFAPDEQITDGGSLTATIAEGTPTGKGSFATIREGVYFVSGYFVFVEEQTIVLDKTDTTPSYEIGFIYNSGKIITATEDASLYDNAQGPLAPNSGAPGADRLAISVDIDAIPLASDGEPDDAAVPAQWIAHTKVVEGFIYENANDNDDNPLTDLMAQRTFEESGNYVLSPFTAVVREELETITDGVSNNGYDRDAVDDSNFIVDIAGSVAYVAGKRVEKSAKVKIPLTIEKPRTNRAYTDKTIGITQGNYFLVTNVEGLPEVDNFNWPLRNSLWAAGAGPGDDDFIGTCLVRGFEESPEREDAYRLYVFDVSLQPNRSIKEVNAISYTATTAGALASTGTAAWWGCEVLSDGATLLDAEHNSNILPLPLSNVESILDNNDNNGILYHTTVTLKADVPGADTFSVNIPSGMVVATTAGQLISYHDDSASTWSEPETPDTLVSVGTTGTASFAHTGLAVNDTTRVVLTLKNIPNQRNHKIKSVEEYYIDQVPYVHNISEYKLEYADGIKASLIYTKENTVAQTTTSAVTDSEFVPVADASNINPGDLVQAAGEIHEVITVVSIDNNIVQVSKAVTIGDNVSVDFIEFVDHTDKFMFSNGQNANYYDLSSIVLNGSVDPTIIPAGPLFVAFDYFNHSDPNTGDYFCVDSYPDGAPIDMADNKDLRDCLDFRPVHFPQSGLNRLPNNAQNHNALPPAAGFSISIPNISVWLGRKDAVFLNTDGEYIYKKGISAINPALPTTGPKNAIRLFNISCAPYVQNAVSDIHVDYINNERFTMADIRALESRIETLEHYTSLTLTEKKITEIVWDDGVDRFKNGWAVDTFSPDTGGVADVTHPDHNVSVDINNQILLPAVTQRNVNMVKDDTETNTVTVHPSGVVTSPINDSNVKAAVQPFSTRKWIINRKGISDFANASIELNPTSDIWYSDSVLPAPASNAWIEYMPSYTKDSSSKYIELNRVDGAVHQFKKTSEYGETFNAESIDGKSYQNALLATLSGVRYNSGTGRVQGRTTVQNHWFDIDTIDTKSIVGGAPNFSTPSGKTWAATSQPTYNLGSTNGSLVPYMRSRLVSFKIKGLRPNTKVYPFFNNKSVNEYCRQTTFKDFGSADTTEKALTIYDGAVAHPDGASDLKSNANGTVVGSFLIPNNDGMKYLSGIGVFEVSNSTTNDDNATSRGEALFYSGRDIPQLSDTIGPMVNSPGSDADDGIYDRVARTSDFKNTNSDPLAQIFKVNDKGGAFLTKVQLFFTEKSGELPIQIAIHKCVKGEPWRKFLTGSAVSLDPAEVEVDPSGNIATDFEFEAPVYVSDKHKYAIVIKTNSSEYVTRVAEHGDITSEGNSKKSYRNSRVGGFFTSYNGTKWKPQRNRDLKFSVRRASFNVGSSELYLINDELDQMLLPNRPFEVISSEEEAYPTDSTATIRVYHPSHGMYGPDGTHTVRLYNVGNAVNRNNIPQDALQDANGYLVKNATFNTYDIDVDYAAGESVGTEKYCVLNTRFGGRYVKATGNIMYDRIEALVDAFEFEDTNVDVEMKGVVGTSADSDVAFLREVDWSPITRGSDVLMNDPHIVFSNNNQQIVQSGKSLRFKSTFTTDVENLTPVVHLARAGATCIQNHLNDPSSGVSDEEGLTNPWGGNNASASKYISKAIQLKTPATGLRVMLEAARVVDSDIEVYYKTDADFVSEDYVPDSDGDGVSTSWRSWNRLGWTQIVNDPAITDGVQKQVKPAEIPVSADPFYVNASERAYTDASFSAEYVGADPESATFSFTKFAIKIVLKSKNSANAPSVKNLRIIATS